MSTDLRNDPSLPELDSDVTQVCELGAALHLCEERLREFEHRYQMLDF